MMKRNADGTFRNNRRPKAVSLKVLRARYIETEVVRVIIRGYSLREAADHITRVGQAQAQPITPIPEQVGFPANYKISHEACRKAYNKAMRREPSLAAEDHRKLDNTTTKLMLRNLWPAIEAGDPQAIAVGIRLLDHSVKVNGYAAPQRHECSSAAFDPDGRMTIQWLRKFMRDNDVPLTVISPSSPPDVSTRPNNPTPPKAVEESPSTSDLETGEDLLTKLVRKNGGPLSIEDIRASVKIEDPNNRTHACAADEDRLGSAAPPQSG